MPRGMFKSGRLRKVFVRTPGGKTVTHYRRRKPGKAVCAVCKKPLVGVAREPVAKMRNMPKTSKRPERPYGGVLCSHCMRQQMKQRVRGDAR